MNITKEEAIRLLSRYDTEYYTPQTREAHRMGIAALNRVEELEKELAEERRRHDRYVDFEMAEAEELEFQKDATIKLRKQWQAAESLICTMCGHCEYDIHDEILSMQMDCGEIVGYPCCGKFVPRNRWISVTERLPESEKRVLVLSECRTNKGTYHQVTIGMYEDGNMWREDSSWCWDSDYLDNCGTYDEDRDDWKIPEGWFEYAIYNEDGEQGVIDDFVTHWQPLPAAPEKEGDK